jgi:hypothetical protein
VFSNTFRLPERRTLAAPTLILDPLARQQHRRHERGDRFTRECGRIPCGNLDLIPAAVFFEAPLKTHIRQVGIADREDA